MNRGSTFDPKLEHRIGEIVSRQEAACGITQILASVLEKKVNPAEEMKISLMLKNTGEVSGTEVVQLYLRDEQASMTRPVKELQGFARVSLAPGEEKKVVQRQSESDRISG